MTAPATLTGPEALDQYEQRMADLRTRALASPLGNPNWCRDFDRFAEELRKTPAPASFGFSIDARPRAAVVRKDAA